MWIYVTKHMRILILDITFILKLYPFSLCILCFIRNWKWKHFITHYRLFLLEKGNFRWFYVTFEINIKILLCIWTHGVEVERVVLNFWCTRIKTYISFVKRFFFLLLKSLKKQACLYRLEIRLIRSKVRLLVEKQNFEGKYFYSYGIHIAHIWTEYLDLLCLW